MTSAKGVLSGFLLSGGRQVLDPAAALRAHGLRVERHEFEDFGRHVGAQWQTELLRRYGPNRIVVRPCPGCELFRSAPARSVGSARCNSPAAACLT